MDQPPKKRSRLGRFLTTAGGVLGVFGVIAMRIGLKVTVRPDNNDVALIRGVFSYGGAIVFGIAVALIIAGAIVGRRKNVGSKLEGSTEPRALVDPSINSVLQPSDSSPISTYDSQRGGSGSSS